MCCSSIDIHGEDCSLTPCPVPRTRAHASQGLRYTGYNLAPKQQQEMRDRLDIDDEGRVVFAEFIDVARDMFAFSLDERMFEPGSLFSLALSPKESIEPPIFSKRVSLGHFVTMVAAYDDIDNQPELLGVCTNKVSMNCHDLTGHV